MSDDLAPLAADAYIYGFPLVFDLQMVGGQAKMEMITPAPFNSFAHASRLAGPGPGTHGRRPLMRLYQPQAAILDGAYKIPPMTKAAS